MHCHDAGCLVHTFPLFRSVRWYAYHAYLCHPLALYAFLHAYLHVHVWVLPGVLSMLQHNEVMDIWSKSTLVSRGHHLLFAFLLVCLTTCLLASLFLCLPCSSWLSALCLFICSLQLFFPWLVCWFLVFAFACTNMERGHLELRHSLPSTGKKGMDVSMWLSQAAVFNRFRSLALPFGYVLF